MVGSRMLEGASRLIIGQLFESLARQVSQNGSGTQTQIEARNSHDKTWWQACWEKIKRLVKGGAA